MPERVLLCGPPQVGKSHLARPLCAEQGYWYLNLDPASQQVSPLACVGLFAPGFQPHGFRFIGSLRITGDPLAACFALFWAIKEVGSEPFVCEISTHQLGAVEVNLLRRLVSLMHPTEIRAIEFPNAERILLPPGSCQVSHVPRDPASVTRPQDAQAKWRKAVWKTYFEGAQKVTLPLSRLRLSGIRFGSGAPFDEEELRVIQELGIARVLYAERIGETLYLVCEGSPPGAVVAAILDQFGGADAHIINPEVFQGLLACVEDHRGWHTTLVRLIEIRFAEKGVTLSIPSATFRRIRSLSPSNEGEVGPPTFLSEEVLRLQVGRLRLAEDGSELGEIRPWQV